jgi:hypothetical protein
MSEGWEPIDGADLETVFKPGEGFKVVAVELHDTPESIDEPDDWTKHHGADVTVQVAMPPPPVGYTGDGMKPALDKIAADYKAAAEAQVVGALKWNHDRPGPMLPASANPKHAAGMAKPPLNLVPPSALIHEALVFQLGAKKYGAFNWRESAVVRSIYLAAAMRHLLALMDGQDLDEESGLPHEAHIRACMAILIDARELGKLIDDRGPAGTAAKLLRKHTVTV